MYTQMVLDLTRRRLAWYRSLDLTAHYCHVYDLWSYANTKHILSYINYLVVYERM